MGSEKNGADGPSVKVIVQDEEVGSSVFKNGALHFAVSSPRFCLPAALTGFSVGRESRRKGRRSRSRRCLVARNEVVVIRKRDRKSLLSPRIRCRHGHVARRSCNGRGRRWEDASP